MSRLPAHMQRARTAAVIGAYARGEPREAIARAFGIRPESVSRIIARANAQRSNDRTEILAAYCAGEKVEAIAAEHGITPRTVHRYAAEARVQRPQGRPNTFPDCPPQHRRRYYYLVRKMGIEEARRALQEELAA